ncbi:MAG: hypothetical protein AAF065_12260 [Verrucomicrobiota bacterium]
MKSNFYQLAVFPLMAAVFISTACGKKSSDEALPAAVEEVDIPETPAAAIQSIVREVASGNGSVLWQAMPASYQDDVNQVAQLAGEKIDSEIYDRVFSTVGRVSQVADKQKEFLFNAGLGTKPPEEQIAKLREAWPSIMELFNSVTSSSISSTELLKNFDGKTFFDETVSPMLLNMDVLSKINPDPDQPPLSAFREAVVNYIEGTDTMAKLEMVMPNGDVQVEDFIKVENSWVPKEMADEWVGKIAEMRSQLENIDVAQIAQMKPQLMGVFTMIDGVLTQIDEAETQEQFDQALQGAMMPLMGLMMMGHGIGGGAPAIPAVPATPGGSTLPSAP